MKKLFTLFAIVTTITIFAQAPQGFNYQAIVRNSSGQLLLNQDVLVKFNILQNSATGDIVYSETHTANTDDLGQINLVVGQGTAPTGTFSTINWGSGSYYLGIELNTGTGYVAMGTTQLLSVPYALYANSSGNSQSATPSLTAVLDVNNSANSNKITNLADPTDAQDAVTKGYVQNLVSQINEIPPGNNNGEMLYWNGTNWVLLPVGSFGQNLTICNGVPTWGTCISTTNGTSIISSFNTCSKASTGTLIAGVTANGVTQTINVTVSKIGYYNISAIANGVTFSASGTFITIGTQDIILTAIGTPFASGTNTFTLNTTPNCNFTLTTLPFDVTDISGNVYKTTQSCNQVWMHSNLNVDRYKNGDLIPQATNGTQWANATTGMWCYYRYDSINGPIYGKIYNWFAVVDPRGLAPQGWHIPSKTEWETLINCYQGKYVAGAALKALDDLWQLDSGTTNSSGFSALPGGKRNGAGIQPWEGITSLSAWWSNTIYDLDPVVSWVLGLSSGNNKAVMGLEGHSNGINGYNSGCYIRCVKD